MNQQSALVMIITVGGVGVSLHDHLNKNNKGDDLQRST
jgi:hypothetical protein